MPIVNIKGVGKAQFPDGMTVDSIREFLRKKYIQQISSGESSILQPTENIAAPYNPSLVEKAGSSIASALKSTGLISDNYGAQQIGKNLTSIGEFLPVIGDAAAGDEFGAALAKGDYSGMALAGLGVIPVAGDLAKKTFKGKVFHQTDSKFDDFDFDKTADGTVWFTDNKANFSDPSSSAGAAAGKGRIIEKEVELNKVAGYDELDKYSVDELVQQGYDGAVLDGDIQVFDPKAISQSLPMDEASRMARAKEQGFDVNKPLYHWSNSSFKEFKLPDEGGFHKMGTGVYLSPNKDFGSRYAKGEGSNVYPAFSNTKIASLDDINKATAELENKGRGLSHKVKWEKIHNKLKEKGFGGLESGEEVLIFDPKNIKSTFEQFN